MLCCVTFLATTSTAHAAKVASPTTDPVSVLTADANAYGQAMIVAFWDELARYEAARLEAERVEAERVAAEAEAARLEAERRRVASLTPARLSPTPSPLSTVGECTGFVIPDYIIQRESGGNPSAYNPSGAYGCAQTLLSHYSGSGVCAGINPYTIEGQRACVQILYDRGGLAPWAATR